MADSGDRGQVSIVCPAEGLEQPLPDGAGSVRVAIDAASGARNLSQRVLRIAPGRSAELFNPASEDVLYVVEGRGSIVLQDLTREALAPGTAVLAPEFVVYGLENEGEADLVLVSVLAPPPVPVPGGGNVPAVRRTGSSPAHGVTHEVDEESLPAGDDRTFKLLIDPRHGCRGVTQFVGFIERSRAPMHTHQYEEAIYVLSGSGVLHAGGTERPIASGASVFLPPGTPHCLENRGADVLKLLGVFSPPGSPAGRQE